MKKVYMVLASLFLILLLSVGFYSLFNLSADAPKPDTSFGSFFDGSYAKGRLAWYAAAFPQSETLKSVNKFLNGFYKFSGFSKEDDVQLIVEMNGQAAQHGASLQAPTETSSTLPDPSGSTEPRQLRRRRAWSRATACSPA